MSLELLSRGSLGVFAMTHRLPVRQSCRFVYASDLHLNPWSQRLLSQVVGVARDAQPCFVALGGDLIDLPRARPMLQQLVERLSAFTQVVAITGNHDWWCGLAATRRALRRAGAILLDHLPWVETGSGLNVHGALHLAGPLDILIAHNPTIFPLAARHGFPLVLAGHLHGCQVTWWERRGKSYPGAWFYGYNGREFHQGPTRMIVSTGVNDTLPLRWNCPREVVAVDIRAEDRPCS